MALEQRRAHLSGRDDRLVKVAPLLAMVADWAAFLNSALPEEELRELREHGRTGRPLGNASFLDRLEGMAGRVLRPQKGGRPSRFKGPKVPKYVLCPCATLNLGKEDRCRIHLETFRWNPAGNQARPEELGQQPEASLAWCRGNPACEA